MVTMETPLYTTLYLQISLYVTTDYEFLVNHYWPALINELQKAFKRPFLA